MTPLTMNVHGFKANFYLDNISIYRQDEPVRVQGHVELLCDCPSSLLLEVYRNYKDLPIDEAHKIYSIYVQAYSDFEVLLQYAGGVENIVRMHVESIEDFFKQEGRFISDGAKWRVDGDSFRHIPVKFPSPRRKNPLCTSRQLVTVKRWQIMQEAVNCGDIPTEELRELYKIYSRTAWNEIRVPAIEASIISESLLRRYGLEMLRQNGFSSTKLKRLQNELSFNNLLNIILPLSLNKTERKKILKAIEMVDNLRSIRNDLMHGNKTEKEIHPTDVKDAVGATIRLVGFIKRKLSTR